jgi:hypothetical protein
VRPLPPGSPAQRWTLPLPAGIGVREAAEHVLARIRREREREPSLLPSDPERVGLYLATPDAGGRISVDFWAEALQVGPGLVLPGTFPWTLASAPAGFLAEGLDIRGPVEVLVGGDDAAAAVLQHALRDLEEGRIDRAEVVVLELADVGERREGRAAGLSLGAPDLLSRLPVGPAP